MAYSYTPSAMTVARRTARASRVQAAMPAPKMRAVPGPATSASGSWGADATFQGGEGLSPRAAGIVGTVPGGPALSKPVQAAPAAPIQAQPMWSPGDRGGDGGPGDGGTGGDSGYANGGLIRKKHSGNKYSKK